MQCDSSVLRVNVSKDFSFVVFLHNFLCIVINYVRTCVATPCVLIMSVTDSSYPTYVTIQYNVFSLYST